MATSPDHYIMNFKPAKIKTQKKRAKTFARPAPTGMSGTKTSETANRRLGISHIGIRTKT